MKTTKLIAVLGLAMAALAACNNKDEMQLPKEAVTITASIEDVTESGTFSPTDVLKLIVYGNNPTPATFNYSQSSPLYWEDVKASAGTTANYTFAGWYSPDTNLDLISNPQFDVSASSYPDLLLAVPAQNVTEGGQVKLNFRQAMHQLQITLKVENISDFGLTPEDVMNAQISLLNMNAAATVDIKTGTVTPGETSDADGTYGPKSLPFSFIVAPQKVTAGTDWIKINIGSQTCTYQIPEQLISPSGNKIDFNQLGSGEKTELTLTMKKTLNGQNEVVLTVNIDMNGKNVEEVKTAIKAALDAGITEFTLTGPIANLGLSDDYSNNLFYKTAVTKLDLSGVTGWEAVRIDRSENTKTVVGLPAYAFFHCNSLQTVVLPEQVKAIGTAAFAFCSSLTEVNLENVTHIGSFAFEDCSALKQVDMSEVTTIYGAAFIRAGLMALSLPKATSISEGAADVGSLTIKPGSFIYCNSLVSVDAPLLTNTGYFSFAYCSALKTVNMPKVTEIKQKAFVSTVLESINFGKVTTVGESAFAGCVLLTEVKLPALEIVGKQAFQLCNGLREIELPATTIGSSLFQDCAALTTLSLPNATTFGHSIVENCPVLTNLKLTAAGALTDVDSNPITAVTLRNWNFKSRDCDLVLNTDKQQSGGGGSPTVTGVATWLNLTWKSITFE